MLNESERIMVHVPHSLLEEIDGMVAVEDCDREVLIRRAISYYLYEQKKGTLRQQLIQGYQQMAGINQRLAEEGMAAGGQSASREGP